MIATARNLLCDLERLLLPNACLCCGHAVEAHDPDTVLCGVCATRLRPLGPGCQRCQQPMPPVGPCRFCGEWETLAWARSAVWLGREARSAVHGLKYGGFTRLAGRMAVVIARHVPRPDRAVLIPVPLGERRHRMRGYNQATLLARALGEQWGLPVSEAALRRVRETRSQTTLDPGARWRNVSAAFSAGETRVNRSSGVAVLIDDVLTTGATLRAAATALRGAQWTATGAITFARALDAGRRMARS